MIWMRLGNCSLKALVKLLIVDLQMAGQSSDLLLENFCARRPCIILVNSKKFNFIDLGIPTSRAASLIISDTKVERDPLYTGNVIYEKCAVVMRVAPTFFRFGSFEVFKETDKYSGKKGPSNGLKHKMMPQMLEFVIKNYYREIFNTTTDLNQQY
jgi:hypothetical protein